MQISIYSDNNNNNYTKEFNQFYLVIKNNFNSYTEKMNDLQNILLLIEKDIINNNYTSDYLMQIKNQVNKTLLEKYEAKLIKSCYHYFHNITKIKVEKILKEISYKWSNYLDLLIIDINKNLNNFKYSFEEIGMINSIYEDSFSQTIFKSYIDSILNHQKNELNYTISLHYNILLTIINSVQQYITRKIPNNKYGLNHIINQRKEKIIFVFNKLISEITISKRNSLLFQNQIKILDITSENLFNINSIVSSNLIEIQRIINNKILQINKINSNLTANDLKSFTDKLYLENSLSEKEIYNLYINNLEYTYLNPSNLLDI